MGVALAARLDAGLAADAAVGVDEEVQVGGFHVWDIVRPHSNESDNRDGRQSSILRVCNSA